MKKRKRIPRIIPIECSITQYADLCGITPQGVWDRIRKGLITTHRCKSYSGNLIDCRKFPPTLKQSAGRKPFKMQAK